MPREERQSGCTYRKIYVWPPHSPLVSAVLNSSDTIPAHLPAPAVSPTHPSPPRDQSSSYSSRPQVHGVYENGVTDYRANGITPYFDVLKSNGYRTAMIGKTHFSPVPTTIDHLDAHTGNSDMRGYGLPADQFLETYLVNQTMAWVKRQNLF